MFNLPNTDNFIFSSKAMVYEVKQTFWLRKYECKLKQKSIIQNI